jgi:hypothetical protein
MPTIHPGKALFTALVALSLTACSSGGLGDILGTPDTGGSRGGTRSGSYASGEVRGTVRYVDTTGDCLIELEDTRFTRGTSYLRDGDDDRLGDRDGERVTVHCDDRTVVMHEGRNYDVAALERGDEIVVEVDESGNRLLAGRIDVLYDVTSDDRADDDRSLGGDLRGTVLRVDREDKTLLLEDVRVYDRDLDDWDGDRVTLYYDTDTDVLFNGERYRADNLEPGDEIEVQAYEVRGRLIAESIEVVSDARASR